MVDSQCNSYRESFFHNILDGLKTIVHRTYLIG
uniref:Uncharacterized protein n=1 Tax=Anguilla anguilla TaxID=7936 RepID=A0A0E9S9I1_ANGAN